jgi:hypothetical protein
MAGGEFATAGLTPKIGNAIFAVETVTDERVDPCLRNQAISTVGIEARVAFGGAGFLLRPRGLLIVGRAAAGNLTVTVRNESAGQDRSTPVARTSTAL